MFTKHINSRCCYISLTFQKSGQLTDLGEILPFVPDVDIRRKLSASTLADDALFLPFANIKNTFHPADVTQPSAAHPRIT
ncbi:hypothetical protein T4B_14993 [Trichinella pseudospiralis]|uniref:Uncharacterized protein n=1 Tax=Trichinella pseudospiralis TaxID=6337 RepID=A0A0V1I9B9_TRIPS|nr:hypothetical protein T4B_14993 [Trichinella pseudospiralis]